MSAARLLLFPLLLLLLLPGCAGNGRVEEVDRAARLNVQLGIAYLRKGDYALAKSKLERALRQDPEYPMAHVASAILYDRIDQPDKAREHYLRALALDSEDASIRNNYGSFLCRRGEWEEARQAYEEAAANRLYKTPEKPLTNAGLCALRHDTPGRAEEYFRRALEANPGFAPALLAMARITFADRRWLPARAYLERLAEVRPATAETLWMRILTERELGNLDEASSLALLLKSRFPDAAETRRLEEMEADERAGNR